MTDLRTRTLRLLVAGALSLGVVATASTTAHALTPPAPQQGIDVIANPEGPDDPTPPQGPGDFTNGEDDECPPLLASCDITSNPGDPGDDDGGDGGQPDAEVDDAVVANPTFTG